MSQPTETPEIWEGWTVDFFRVSIPTGDQWVWPKNKTGSALLALHDRAKQQEKIATALLNYFSCLKEPKHFKIWLNSFGRKQKCGQLYEQESTENDRNRETKLTRRVMLDPLYSAIELLWYYNYHHEYALSHLTREEKEVYKDTIRKWRDVQQKIRLCARRLAKEFLPEALQARIDELPWKIHVSDLGDLALKFSPKVLRAGIHILVRKRQELEDLGERTILLEGLLELSVQCCLQRFPLDWSLEQVESELKTIFAPEDMLPLEDTAEQDTSAHSTWGLFGAPRMMFIALIDEGFLIAGTAQCLVLGKKDRKVKEAFGKYVVDAIQNRFKDTRREKLVSLPGANEIKALQREMQQGDFDTPAALDSAVGTFAGKAMQNNRTGQAFSSHPLWKRRGPCGKCAVIYQFRLPSPTTPHMPEPCLNPSPSTTDPPNLKVFDLFNCAEDAWELKRRYIQSPPQTSVQGQH